MAVAAPTPNLDIVVHSSRSVEQELDENTKSVLPYFVGTFAVMVRTVNNYFDFFIIYRHFSLLKCFFPEALNNNE